MLLRTSRELEAQGAKRCTWGCTRGPDPRLTSTLALAESKMGPARTGVLLRAQEPPGRVDQLGSTVLDLGGRVLSEASKRHSLRQASWEKRVRPPKDLRFASEPSIPLLKNGDSHSKSFSIVIRIQRIRTVSGT